MNEKDYPNFDGPDNNDAIGKESAADETHRKKLRCKKMFELGHDPNTPEQEMTQALQRARRYIEKNNFNEEEILNWQNNPDLMNADVVRITVRSVGTAKSARIMKWF